MPRMVNVGFRASTQPTRLIPCRLDAFVLQPFILFFLCKFKECHNPGYGKWSSLVAREIICLLQRCRILSKRITGLMFVFIIFFPCLVESSALGSIGNGLPENIDGCFMFWKSRPQDINVSIFGSCFQKIQFLNESVDKEKRSIGKFLLLQQRQGISVRGFYPSFTNKIGEPTGRHGTNNSTDNSSFEFFGHKFWSPFFIAFISSYFSVLIGMLPITLPARLG